MWPCEDQYSRDQAIAQVRIPKYRSAQAKRRARHGGDRPHLRRGRRRPRYRRPANGAVARLDRACGCRRRRSRTPRSLTGERMAKKRVAVLISGRGSNMAALIEAAKERSYPAETALVVSNGPEAAGLARAEAQAIPTAVVDHRPHGKDRAAFERALQAVLDQHRVELVCLGGFMRLLTRDFVLRWQGRMLNIHPA